MFIISRRRYELWRLPFDEAQDRPFGSDQSRVGKREEENGTKIVFLLSCYCFLGARRYISSRLVSLELCELNNNSYTGTKGKATGLLKLTRLQADLHSAGLRDHDIQRHQRETDEGGYHDPLVRFLDFGLHVPSSLNKEIHKAPPNLGCGRGAPSKFSTPQVPFST